MRADVSLFRPLTLAILSCALAMPALTTGKTADEGKRSTQPSRFEWVSENYRNRDYPLVRLITLLVDGSALIDHKVTVVGVLSVEFEDTKLYLTKDSYGYFDTSNALALTLTSAQVSATKAMQGRYVEVSGMVAADPSAMTNGSMRIVEIVRVALRGPQTPRP